MSNQKKHLEEVSQKYPVKNKQKKVVENNVTENRFSAIKRSVKKPKDINERIEYLEKEFQKTGLNEKITMSTSGLYSVQGEEENPAYATFNNASCNGKGFAMTSMSGLSIGGAYTDANGYSYAPDGTGPATSWRGIASGMAPSKPGYQRSPEHRRIGAFLWYWNGSSYSRLEWKFTNQNVSNAGQWAQWKSGAYSPFLDPILGDASFDPNCLAAVLAAGGGGAFPDPDAVTPPTHPVLFQNDLSDPGFLPIDAAKRFIAGMLGLAQQGLEFLGNLALNEPQDYFNDIVSLAIPPNPENNYAPDIAGSIADNKPRVYENDDIPDDHKEKLIKNIDWTDIGVNIPITTKPTNYSDDNFYVNDDGNVTPHTSDSKTEFPPNTHAHQGDTPNYSDNPLGNAGEYHFELVVPEDGSEPYFNYEDHAYYNPNSADKGEVPNWVSNALANVSQSAGEQLPGYPEGIKGDVVKKVKIPLSDALKTNPDIRNSPRFQEYFNESYITEGVALGHFDPEVLNVDINDIRKGIMPEFPKDAPPKMVDGYSSKSRLAPKVLKGEPFIKVTKKDLAALHILKDSEIKELLQQINLINAYLKKNPAVLVYAQQRYPKDDIRLAQLNFKMDEMKRASDEYIDKQFPENKKLFDKLQDKIKQNIELTDPKNFIDHKRVPTFIDTMKEQKKMREKKKNRKWIKAMSRNK